MSTEIINDIEKLSEWATEIDPIKEGKLAQEIILALKDTMRENGLSSLSAPQIGHNRRIFCIRFGKEDYRTFINPMIENNMNITMSRETCSSIPEKTFMIPRFSKVKCVFVTPLGKVQTSTLNGKAAYVFQHCLDHLNGVVVSDIGLEIDELFDNATTEEQEEVIRMYIESLDLRHKSLTEEIKQDKDLNELDEAIRFIAGVNDGSVVLDKETTKKE